MTTDFDRKLLSCYGCAHSAMTPGGPQARPAFERQDWSPASGVPIYTLYCQREGFPFSVTSDKQVVVAWEHWCKHWRTHVRNGL